MDEDGDGVVGADRSRGPGVRVPPPLIFATFAVVGFALDWIFPLVAVPGFARALGVALFLAGIGLELWAVALFWRRGTNPFPWTADDALVAEGPYRFTRNPMYLGMTANVAGLGLALASPLMALMALPAAVVVDRSVIAREEAYLLHRFGAAYGGYRDAVRRWL